MNHRLVEIMYDEIAKVEELSQTVLLWVPRPHRVMADELFDVSVSLRCIADTMTACMKFR